MAQLATVLYVMIASPADIPVARDQAFQAVTRWNESNTANRNVVLVPLRWETSAVPTLGRHPQALINTQLVDRADIVIALFGSRLGSVTPDAISGTVEEIETARDAGKPVHLYFSEAPHPNDVDPDQLKALLAFKEEIQAHSLYGSFTSPEELTAHIWQAIEHDVVQLSMSNTDVFEKRNESGVDFLVQPGQESLPTTDSRGRLKNQTKRWIEVINRGDRDASGVTVESKTDGVFITGPDDPTTIHAGQKRRFSYMLTFAAPSNREVLVRWKNGELDHEEIFSY